MRGGAFIKFIEAHAVATGFGASVAAHAVLVAALASTRGNDELARNFTSQHPAAISRDDVTTIALALELPETHDAREQETIEMESVEIVEAESTTREVATMDSVLREDVPDANVPEEDVHEENGHEENGHAEHTPKPAQHRHEFAQALTTLNDALRPSRDALRATAVDALRGINAYLARASAPMRHRAASDARSTPVATHESQTATTANLSSVDASSTESTTGVLALATVIEVKQPEYPRRSARLGHEGTARVEVRITPNGDIHSITLIASSGFAALDEAALAAARRGRFAPATRDERPVESYIVLPFDFRLK